MALQHFYSRVPARMSMFNRTDSFDTFAFSAGLEREFIEKELAAVYDNKPSKNDAALIRTGKLKPVYSQYFTKSGKFVQSCTSFLPLDYTGERSAYFTHILVPDEAEEKELLASSDNFLLNPDMFIKDISQFNLTDDSAKPDDNYPTMHYEPLASNGTDSLTQYDSAMMKRLIFAMLNLACGKGKNIFISLPFKKDDYSKEALNFINTILQIFPYHLRRAFSFVTYTDDGTRYNGFNIRFIPEGVHEIPLAKGMTLHFGSKIAIGLSDEMVVNNNLIVDFFFNLIKNDAIRRDFLQFVDKAVTVEPLLKKANLKTMTELVFLFEQCSGLFNEKTILPTDTRVYDFICAYDRHRNALSEEYRAIAMKCLERYPDNHSPIPKEVFQKIARIYPNEPFDSKKVIMGVVLELIHTDLMRDKLFNFVKANYEYEGPVMRSDIALNLCRVYYGGFLQIQILSFFEEIFHNESEETKNTIIDKLLLTIRTPAVKAKIIEFFDKNYDAISQSQKERFFETFLEMLPECDSLTADLLKLVNGHIEKENSEILDKLGKKVYTILENDQRKKEPQLLKILLSVPGYCTLATLKTIFFEHAQHKIFINFVKEFNNISNKNKLILLEDIWNNFPDMDASVAERWANELCEDNQESKAKYNLFELMELEKALKKISNKSNSAKVFADIVLANKVRPAILKSLPDAFNTKIKKDGLKVTIEYGSNSDYLLNASEYVEIKNFAKLLECAKELKYEEMVEVCIAFANSNVKQGICDHIKSDILVSKEFKEEKFEFMKMELKVLLSFVASGEIALFDIYSDCFSATVEKLMSGENGVNREAAELEGAKKSIENVLKIAQMLYLSNGLSENKDLIVKSDGSMFTCLSDFAGRQKKALKWIEEYLQSNNYEEDFAKKITVIFESIKTSSKGFFKKLFKK